ncbi:MULTISPECIES: response regulator transcription factor [unclassified Sphingopyxis]|uniref:response regulator transcription factor n=1 Tax=unclassified Sphingopyxis TaxID=2614943 RepID=UPI0018D2494C|nr:MULTISPECIES: helix-turn-helix transcriptional regulator [unclassified Sphingopyxis]
MKQNFPLPPEAAALAARLSGRQRECLILVRNGLTSKEIGRLLSLAPSTVDNHLNAATERLGCSSRAIAAQILEMAEQFGDQSHIGNETKTSSNESEHSGDMTAHPRPRRSYFLPPFGGSPNEETAARRITHIGLIAIAATMAFAAITITVAGVIELFSK